VFVSGKFLSKTIKFEYDTHPISKHVNIRRAQKSCEGQHSLAYFTPTSVTKKKFMTLTPEANVINLFLAVISRFSRNKLECLSLASLSSLV
jgi:hypothetical protein